MRTGSFTHFRTCHLCEAMCGVAIEVKDGVIAEIRGDHDDVFSRGHICPKAVALKDVHEDPDRLRRPLRRTGSTWQEIGWDEALDEAAQRLCAVQKAHGRNAVALYQGNPNVHNYGAALYGQLLARSLGSRSLYSATSVDQLPHMLASLLMFGHQFLFPVPDLDRTDHLLMLGANPLASNGSLMSAGGGKPRLDALRRRGGRLVVVDPRRTETAAIADLHVPIRPGTDAALLLAILHVLHAEKLTRPGRLAGFTDGLDALAELSRAWPPQRVAAATGVPADTIERLARELAAAPRAVCYGRVGVSTQEFGGLACWLIVAINLVTGNLDREGGAMFPLPAVDLAALTDRIGLRGHFDKGRSRVSGRPEFGGEWPAGVLAEEIETPGEGQVRALVCSAGNPVLSTPNGARLERSLAGLDFLLSIDIYLNETSRHAHLVLPPTFALEHDHYDLIFHALAVRDTAKYSEPLFDPGPDARHDWQILGGLARRIDQLKGRYGWRSRLTHAALSHLGPSGLLGLLLRTGPHGAGLFGSGLTLGRLRKAPHGIDLGPLRPAFPRRIFTKDRRIDAAPARLLADVPRLEAALARHDGSLQLIGRRDVRSNNSWMHNSERLVKGRDRCTLQMSPLDAAARALTPGDRVRVTSRVGTVEAGVEIADAMMPGVVCLPHGWGHGREGTRLRVANGRPGVSINDVTDDQRVDDLCGTAAFSATPVEVTRSPAAD
jgi:anaerobic selenocysteine-containing dehydrogenase